MGLFSKKEQPLEQTCALCDRVLRTPEEKSIGLCVAHAIILDTDVKVAADLIKECQEKANAEKNPDQRIIYLRGILDQLYKLKVKYYENGIEPLTENIDDLIDNIIDCISTVRIETNVSESDT